MKTSIAQSLKKDVEANLAAFEKHWDEYGGEKTPEAVHNQRITVNRLLGYAMFLGLAGEKKSQWPTGLRGLRTWQKRIGHLRDLDIMLEWLGKCLEHRKGKGRRAAIALEQNLLNERDSVLEAVLIDVRGFPGAEARLAAAQAGKEFAENLRKKTRRPSNAHPAAALAGVADPWLRELEGLYSDQSDEALHSFRIRNKRLRFVLEILAQNIDDKDYAALLKDRAKTAKAIHTCLGNLSDLTVFGERLRICRAQWSAQNHKIEESACALEEGRNRLMREELRQWFALWPQITAREYLGALMDTKES